MRKLLLSLILSGAAWAQSPFQIQFVTTDPTGACTVPSYPGYITLNRVTGNLKGCVNGSWASIGGGGAGNVAGPGSSTVGNIPTWTNTLGSQIGTGLGLVTTVGNPGSNTNIPSEASVRSAIAGIGGTPGGLTGQIQYNNSGSFGGLVSSSGTVSVSAGSIDVNPNTVPYMAQYQTATPTKCIANALGSGTAYVGTITPSLTGAYSLGAPIIFVPDVASTGPFTIDCGFGPLNVYYNSGVQAGANALRLLNSSGVPVTIRYMSALNAGSGGWIIDSLDTTSPTFAGTVTTSGNGAASTPVLYGTGTWFTGGTSTTTKPYWLFEPTGTTSNAWSTNGTGLGINAASGFVGNLMDFQTNGISRFSLTAVGTMTVAGDVKIAPGQSFYWTGRSRILSPSDGQVSFKNQASTTYADLQYRSLMTIGTVPSISTGSCGTPTISGGATAGEITSNTSGTCAATLTFAMTATTGWSCWFADITTPANHISQDATSTTTTTASFTGSTTSGDKIRYGCIAF